MNIPKLPQPDAATCEAACEALTKAFDPVRAYYTWVDGPFGRVFIAKTDRGVCRVSFRKTEDELARGLECRGLLPEESDGQCERERRQLGEYFDGTRTEFDAPVDLRWGTPFQRDVLEAARAIPFGHSARYQDVADRIGRPRAQRAVGNALGSNPVAILIPCHRVVGSGGRLGGYTGGLDIKRTLMEIEGIEMEVRT